MKYRAQHWKDVPGVKYPEPQPTEGWVSTREAVARLGMVYNNKATIYLRQKGIRTQRWSGANGYRQLVWCVADVANAQNAPKNARAGKVASVPARTGKHGGRQAAESGRE